MTELYLILHKVRGEPAFDIAQLIGEDSDGDLWIIPTSGHRAHPAQAWKLDTLEQHNVDGYKQIGYDAVSDERWPSWPDHYATKREPAVMLTNARELLARIGLGSTTSIKRRKVG